MAGLFWITNLATSDGRFSRLMNFIPPPFLKTTEYPLSAANFAILLAEMLKGISTITPGSTVALFTSSMAASAAHFGVLLSMFFLY